MEHTESQEKRILADMLTGVRLTSIEALTRYGCARLASRVNDLKKQGFDVRSETIVLPNKKRVSQYYIESKPKPKEVPEGYGTL